MNLLLNLLLVSLPFAYSIRPIENYHWKDFNGLVPHDAFLDETEQFIGSVPIGREGIFIGTLQNDTKQIKVSASVSGTYGSKLLTVNDDIKILCTSHPSSLQWIRTSNETFSGILYDPIVGGYDDDVLYIGRIYDPPDGEKLFMVDTYDVLVYNPDANPAKTGSSVRSSSGST